VIFKRIEDFEVFKAARKLSIAVVAIVGGEGFGNDCDLRRQLLDASDSVVANLAEGFEQPTDRAFAKYVYTSKASAAEVRARLGLAHDRRCIADEELREGTDLADHVTRLCAGLIRHLLHSNRKDRGVQRGKRPTTGDQPATSDRPVTGDQRPTNDCRLTVDLRPTTSDYEYHPPMPKLTVEGHRTVDVEPGKRLVLAIEQDAKVDVLHACGGNARCTTCRVEFIAGEPERMTVAEKTVLAAKGASGVRLSCQITVDQDMVVRAISRLEGSGRPDPGATPLPTVQPPPEYTTR